MANIFEKIFHFDQKEVNRYAREAERVMAYDEQMTALSDEQLADKTKEFKERLANGESLDSIKYEAFAVAREAQSHEVPLAGHARVADLAEGLPLGNVGEVHFGGGQVHGF